MAVIQSSSCAPLPDFWYNIPLCGLLPALISHCQAFIVNPSILFLLLVRLNPNRTQRSSLRIIHPFQLAFYSIEPTLIGDHEPMKIPIIRERHLYAKAKIEEAARAASHNMPRYVPS